MAKSAHDFVSESEVRIDVSTCYFGSQVRSQVEQRKGTLEVADDMTAGL